MAVFPMPPLAELIAPVVLVKVPALSSGDADRHGAGGAGGNRAAGQ